MVNLQPQIMDTHYVLTAQVEADQTQIIPLLIYTVMGQQRQAQEYQILGI